jgi:hypothetical protein
MNLLPTNIHRVPRDLGATRTCNPHAENRVVQPDERDGRPAVGACRVVRLSLTKYKILWQRTVGQVGAISFQKVGGCLFPKPVIAEAAQSAIGIGRIVPAVNAAWWRTVLRSESGFENLD